MTAITATCPLPVRLALPRDREAVFNLMIEGYLDNGRGNLNHKKVLEVVDYCLDHKGGLIGVIEEKGVIVATVILSLSQYCYTDDWHLQEIVAYVHRDHRRSTHAKDLITFSKWCADQLGLELHMGIISHERVEAKVRLYSRQMQQTGAIFTYVPGHITLRDVA
jgi:hypothetical protein